MPRCDGKLGVSFRNSVAKLKRFCCAESPGFGASAWLVSIGLETRFAGATPPRIVDGDVCAAAGPASPKSPSSPNDQIDVRMLPSISRVARSPGHLLAQSEGGP